MFCSAEMLRYDQDSKYKTATGGLITISIVIVVIAGFFNMISETINRTAISYTLNAKAAGDPTPFTLTANNENKFMFGLQIQSMDLTFFYNLSQANRYFDLVVQQQVYKYGVLEKK